MMQDFHPGRAGMGNGIGYIQKWLLSPTVPVLAVLKEEVYPWVRIHVLGSVDQAGVFL